MTAAAPFVIDGKTISAGELERVTQGAREARRARRQAGPRRGARRRGSREPGLCRAQGQGGASLRLPFGCNIPCRPTTAEAELIALVAKLNADPPIHGILVQLPLPKAINAAGARSDRAGQGRRRLPSGQCRTPRDRRARPRARSLHAGRRHDADRPGRARRLAASSTGSEAVVVGRSNIVGKPMAQLLLARNCTVTIAHSRTRDLPAVARRADVLVAAVGRPEMVRGDWIKPGAIVIDVGINRVAGPRRARARRASSATSPLPKPPQRAGAITPVPGGVGPMTIAMLMANTLPPPARATGVEAPKF